MSDLISRQAAIDAVKWGESVLSVRDAIAGLPSVWKPASVKPKRDGYYLVLWNLREGDELNYKAMYYSERIAWEGWRNRVRYWTELPDMPEVKNEQV